MGRERAIIVFESGRELEAVIDRGRRKNLYINIKEGEVIIKVPLICLIRK